MQMIYFSSELWQLLSCYVKVSLQYIYVAENCLTCTVFIGEMLMQVWLKE